jgi:hypothetical protein
MFTLPTWFNLIPWKVIGIFALIIGVFGYGYHQGTVHENQKQLIINAKSVEDAVAIAKGQAAVSLEMERRSWEAAQQTKVVTRTITKVIHDEKPSDDCHLSVGWVQRHNESATNTLPAAPAINYEAYSGITASQALEGIAENYGTCHEIRQIAVDCQDWIKGQMNVK